MVRCTWGLVFKSRELTVWTESQFLENTESQNKEALAGVNWSLYPDRVKILEAGVWQQSATDQRGK